MKQRTKQVVYENICIECGFLCRKPYKKYKSGSIVLSQCSECKKQTDKYIECDFVIIFIDFVLQKRQVYRHLIFNRHTVYSEWKLFRKETLILFFLIWTMDTYLDIQRQAQYRKNEENYLFFFINNKTPFEIFLFHVLSSFLYFIGIFLGERFYCFLLKEKKSCLFHLLYAFLLTYFTKIFGFLFIFWGSKEMFYRVILSIMFILSNIEIFKVVMKDSYSRTVYSIFIGMFLRFLLRIFYEKISI